MVLPRPRGHASLSLSLGLGFLVVYHYIAGKEGYKIFVGAGWPAAKGSVDA